MLVYFMDEHFVCNSGLHLVGSYDKVTEAHTSILVVLSLSIYNIYKCSTIPDQSRSISFEHMIAWKVKDRKLNVWVVIHVLLLNLGSW